MAAKSRDGLGGGGPSLVVEGGDVCEEAAAVVEIVDVGEREGGLAGVVGEEEVAGGGGAAPGTADGTAAEEVFGGQADEDLPDGDLVREAAEERRRCGLRHGRWPGVHPGSRSICPGAKQKGVVQ